MSFRPNTVAVFLAMFLSACQKYSIAPLDLEGHQRSLEARDPAASPVVEYARTLGAPAQRGGAFDPSDGLSLDEAEVVALFFNPQLRVARLKAEVPRVGAAAAGRWEDPQFGIDVERIIESVQHPWVLAGTIHFTLPLSGRLEVERQKAEEEARTETLRALSEEQRVLAELRAQWLEWSAAVERAALTRKVIEELDTLVSRADRLRDAGELDPIDARLLRLERMKQSGRLLGHESDGREAEIKLKSRLGLVPDAPVKLLPSLAASALALPDRDGIPALILKTPRMQVVRAEYAIAERTLELAVRKQYPDVNLGGGLGTDRGDNNVLFGVALPLPLLNGNRREIAEARAAREVARAAAEGEQERLLGEFAAAQWRLEGARRRVEQVERELAPLADQQVEDARRLGRAGVFNTLLLLQAIQAAHEARLEVIAARLALRLVQQEIRSLLDPGRGREKEQP